jgi:hypothetical protein
LVLALQIDVAVGVHVVQDGGDLGKTRQNLSHENFWLPHLNFLPIFTSFLSHFLQINFLALIPDFHVPSPQ